MYKKEKEVAKSCNGDSSNIFKREKKYRSAYFQMKQCLKNMKVPSFPEEWERNIRNLFPTSTSIASRNLFLQDVKDLYISDMEKFNEQIIFSCETFDTLSILNKKRKMTETHAECKVKNRSSFVLGRNLLIDKYFLYLDTVKVIMNSAEHRLPKVICDFNYYHDTGVMALEQFSDIVSDDIKKGSLVISNKFYTDVSRAIERSKISNIGQKQLSNALRCLTNVFVQQIISVKIRSIDHIIKLMDQGRNCPQIEMKLLFEDQQFHLMPKVEEILLMYHNILNNIDLIAQDLMPLEEWLNIRTNKKFIKIKLPEWYLKESHDKLESILIRLYKPVEEHLNKITEEFQPICDFKLDELLHSSSSAENTKFDFWLQGKHNYDAYLSKANEMETSRTYKIGILEQSQAKKSLKLQALSVTNTFICQLVNYHQEFNKSICHEFEELKNKALDVPGDARGLIKLSEYISNTSKLLLDDLEVRIQESIRMLCSLIDITILTDEHIALNRETINWLSKIGPVFAQNNTLTEAMKSELEEDMQRRINSLNSTVDDIVPQLSVLDEMDDINRIQEYVEYYKTLLKQVKQIESEMERINEEERLFRFPETEFPNVIEVKEIIMPFYLLIYTIHQWQRDNSVWLDGPFEWLDAAIIEKKTLNNFNEITEMGKSFKARIKMDVTANKCFKFSGIADDPEPMQQPAPLKLCWQALNDINDFKKYLPLVTCMCNPALQKRHWEEMSTICKMDLTPNAGTTLRKIIALDLMDDIQRYQAISISANRELSLQKILSHMIEGWNGVSFEIIEDTRTNMMIFENLDEIEVLLAEHRTKIEEMQASSFVQPVELAVNDFLQSLLRVQEILYYWDYIQARRFSLSSIFSYPMIEKSLYKEKSFYSDVEEVLMDVKKSLSDSPNFQTFNNSVILESLREASETLDSVDKSVKDYMQIKRLRFTRFFFLSDNEIQNLLFEQNSQRRGLFLKKCFTGVEGLCINNKRDVYSILGTNGEELQLLEVVPIRDEAGQEEKWLLELEKKITAAVQKSILQSYQSMDDACISYKMTNLPSMAVICAQCIYWTCEVHEALQQNEFTALLVNLEEKYNSYIRSLVNETKASSSRRNRCLISCLILTVSHQLEIIRLLLERKISKSTDFEWIAQLKYYVDDNAIIVSTFNVTMKYGYEFNYNGEKLVNTALTDRCYHTLIQAYKYHFYGALVGPSSTGKTETIKNLARALAVQFHVFNCNESIPYHLVSQLLKGFLTCGAWLCFENFEKLKIQVLSAITQTLVQVSQAVSANFKLFSFDGFLLDFNPNGHVCVTMNLGQACSSNIPDNLKMLFRTASMMVPDMRKITEVELFAAGFSEAKNIALKVVTFYKLLLEQLWCESCKNFDLGSLKVLNKSAVKLKQNFPDEDETMLIVRSLIDTIIPRLCSTDMLTFRSILADVFPFVDLFASDYSKLLDAVATVCESKSIGLHDTLKLKIIQVFELLQISQGLILIGETYVGKTNILSILADSLTLLQTSTHAIPMKINIEIVTPSVANYCQLFGHFDKRSNIWKDGICSKVLRCYTKDNFSHKTWIVFDGPLNIPWIETLYTVLDTNRTLYLASGEKLDVPDTLSIIFETSTIEKTSPAVVSRCGVVYIESLSIDWRPYVVTHISKEKLYDSQSKMLCLLFEWVLEPCLLFVEQNCVLISTIGRLHLVMAVLSLFDIYLKDACMESTEETGKINHFLVWAQAALMLAIAWGIGGNLSVDCNPKFNAFCMTLWGGGNSDYPKPEAIKHFEITLPPDGLIQDSFYSFKGIGNWKHWHDLLKTEKIVETPEFNQVFVPTATTLKYSNLFYKHIKHHKPFIVLSNGSCGKTSILEYLLKKKLPQEEYLCNFLSFASLDTIATAQNLILLKLNKLKRQVYGPPKNMYCVTFCDDFNITDDENSCEKEKVLELLRQYLNYGYFYESIEGDKILIRDVMFCLAVTTQNGRYNLCQRFLRHFNIYTMNLLSADTMSRIFSNTLFANLKRNLFTADVQSNVTSMTNATIAIYNSILDELRHVPSKFQYFFNMRDIARVISGCSLLQKESVETKVTFIRLWVHEVWRVFGDRILNKNDKEWLFGKIKETVKANFKDSFETAFDYLPKSEDNQLTAESFKDLIFANFMDTERATNRRYEEFNSMEALKKKIMSSIAEYNANLKTPIDIVLTRYALECLIKIARILATPRANLLMIASPACGRRSITSLAALTQQQSFFEPSVYAYNDPQAWRDDLKTVLKKCGGERKESTFFFPDKEIRKNLLQDISSLLATGEIPDLFNIRDRQSLVEIVRLHAQSGNRNAEMSIRSVMNYFTEECRNKLHLIICLSPKSDALKYCIRACPTLVKHCTINWYEMWPESAFMQIGVKYMEEVTIPEDLKPTMIQAAIKFYDNAQEICGKYYRQTGRVTHVSPSSYLHMLKLYSKLISNKQDEIVAMRNRYLAGLEKLELAAKQVEQMKATLTILKPQLEQSAQQMMITMKEVENENATVEKATILVKEEEEVANKKTEIAAILRTECEADLAVAIPILEDAVAALNTLKPTDITLVKAMKNPPDTVKLVMAAVCVMLNVPPDKTIDPVTGKKYIDYWSPSKRILGDMNFLQNLKEYDKDNIPASVMQTIKKIYMMDNSFMPHIVAKASSAAEGLCKWVRAIVSYDEVAKVVAPKKEKLNAAQRECDEAEAFLNEKRRTLAALNAKLAALNNSLQETLQQKLKLETEVMNCTNKLKTAENLIASLGGEKNRWMQCAENLQVNYDNLIGDMILSSVIIAYMPPYSIAFRDELVESWRAYMEEVNIRHSDDFNFMKILGDDSEINNWYSHGLPKNRFSTQNAIIMRHSNKWCLFIDSQNQANQWLKGIEEKNELRVIKLTDSDCKSVIKQSLQIGKPILIENVNEKLHVLLDPILLKQIYKTDGSCYLSFGNESVEYSKDFRLYLTTRLVNPRYSYEVFSKVTIIDFSIPNEALQDRLLDVVISKEKPELQGTFENLLVQDVANKRILKQQEENILTTLSSSTANILEDENAIQILDASKNLSLDIIKKQKAIQLMAEETNAFRKAYITFVKHCAGLFSTLNSLCKLNHMYRFSFSWFIQLYIRSIDTANRSRILEKRLQFLKNSFTQNLHRSVCLSLSEKHKILYSFLLCSKILLDTGKATEEEINFFLAPTTNTNDTYEKADLVESWLPQDVYKEIIILSNQIPAFHELVNEFSDKKNSWAKYYNSQSLEDDLMPEPWQSKLSQFQKLILIKTMRADKIFIEIVHLIESTMGRLSSDPPQHKISQSYAESSCLTPLIFILPCSPSPLSLITAFAATKGYTSKLTILSMGEGQEQKAEMLIAKAKCEGGWIFLQNCHLVQDWMLQLEKICQDSSKAALDFRLWLSSYPFDHFPISILQNSIKITHDCPLSFKEQLLNLYRSDPIGSKEFFEGCPGKDKTFSKLLFGLCFFHIVALQRNDFGIQGWNVNYNFDFSDFEISIIQLQDLINISDSVPFHTILYIIGDCNYGGKVVDNLDKIRLRNLLKNYCNNSIIRESRCNFFSDIESLIPQRCEYHHVLLHIENMPSDLSPEVFGSNENGVIIRDTTIATEFISLMSVTTKIILPIDEQSMHMEVLKIIDDIIDTSPDSFDTNNLKMRWSSEDPLNRFFIHEVELFNKTVSEIKKSLETLQLLFTGEIVISDYLSQFIQDLYNSKVPKLWRSFQNGLETDNLSRYINNIVKRGQFIQDWINNDGHSKDISFTSIVSHKMFLSALLLKYSKKHSISIEKISLHFSIPREDTTEHHEEAYNIIGLHLSGAQWNFSKNILEKSPINVFWQNMPPIQVQCDINEEIKSETYECPMYVTAYNNKKRIAKDINTKQNHIANVPLRSDIDSSYWIKCNTSLYCHIP